MRRRTPWTRSATNPTRLPCKSKVCASAACAVGTDMLFAPLCWPGRLMEFDLKNSGELKVHYSERLVTLLREVRVQADARWRAVWLAFRGSSGPLSCGWGRRFAACRRSAARSTSSCSPPWRRAKSSTATLSRQLDAACCRTLTGSLAPAQLKQVANFYNTISEQILPSQVPSRCRDAR